MSFMTRMNRDMATEIGEITGKHEIRLTLSIQDEDALWDAAAARLRVAGLEDDEIAECIGSRADISSSDCLSTLFLPLVLAGCSLTDITVREALPNLDELMLAAAQATSHIGARASPLSSRFPS